MPSIDRLSSHGPALEQSSGVDPSPARPGSPGTRLDGGPLSSRGLPASAATAASATMRRRSELPKTPPPSAPTPPAASGRAAGADPHADLVHGFVLKFATTTMQQLMQQNEEAMKKFHDALKIDDDGEE